MSIRSASPALAAALLFGASTPLAKALVGEVPPLLLAGLLYLGSGLGLGSLLAWRWWRQPGARQALRMPPGSSSDSGSTSSASTAPKNQNGCGLLNCAPV